MRKPIEKPPTLVEYVQAQVDRDRRLERRYRWGAIAAAAVGIATALALLVQHL